MQDYVVDFDALGMGDVGQVGGKNASLGEMISNLAAAGVRVPGGFATTARAYWEFLDSNGLRGAIRDALEGLDVDDVEQLAATGSKIRQMILDAQLTESLDAAIRAGFDRLEAKHPG